MYHWKVTVSFLVFMKILHWFLIFSWQVVQNIVIFILIGLLGKQWRWSGVNCLHPVSVQLFFYYAILVPILIIIIFCYHPSFYIFQIFYLVLLAVTLLCSDRFYMVIWCLSVSYQIYIRCQIKEHINCWRCWWNKSCQNESVSYNFVACFLDILSMSCDLMFWASRILFLQNY